MSFFLFLTTDVNCIVKDNRMNSSVRPIKPNPKLPCYKSDTLLLSQAALPFVKPLPHMPISGSFNSAARKKNDVKNMTNGLRLSG